MTASELETHLDEMVKNLLKPIVHKKLLEEYHLKAEVLGKTLLATADTPENSLLSIDEFDYLCIGGENRKRVLAVKGPATFDARALTNYKFAVYELIRIDGFTHIFNFHPLSVVSGLLTPAGESDIEIMGEMKVSSMEALAFNPNKVK